MTAIKSILPVTRFGHPTSQTTNLGFGHQIDFNEVWSVEAFITKAE